MKTYYRVNADQIELLILAMEGYVKQLTRKEKILKYKQTKIKKLIHKINNMETTQ